MVNSAELYNWSVHYLNLNTIAYSQKSPLIFIDEFLRQSRIVVKVEDDNFYKRVTIKINGNGVKVRDEVQGNEIKTKRQFLVKEGQFIFSRIDARNGAFGLATAEINNAIVTNDFPVFDIDENKINAEFFALITGTQHFFDYCQSLSSGTTNRQRIDEKAFLSFQIPLPPNDIQTQFVKDYKLALEQAEQAEQQANQLEKDIESYLLDELGIEIKQSESKAKNKLHFVNLKDVTRWDIDFLLNETSEIFSILNKARFSVKKLGNIYNFVTRSWKKKSVKQKTFCYVEIGKVDSFLGITGFTEIEVKNAPSRATQVINKNDLIIGLTRPNLKKFALVSEEYSGYIFSSGFQVIEPANNYSLEFLSEFLKSEAGVKQFEFFMSGALYPAITTKQFKDLEIPLPPLDIQTKIVNHINTQKAEIKKRRIQAKTLREQAKHNFEAAIFE